MLDLGPIHLHCQLILVRVRRMGACVEQFRHAARNQRADSTLHLPMLLGGSWLSCELGGILMHARLSQQVLLRMMLIRQGRWLLRWRLRRALLLWRGELLLALLRGQPLPALLRGELLLALLRGELLLSLLRGELLLALLRGELLLALLRG